MQMLCYMDDPHGAATSLLNMALSSDHSLQKIGHLWWTKVTVPWNESKFLRELRPYGYFHAYRFHAIGYAHDLDTRSFEIDRTGKLHVMHEKIGNGGRGKSVGTGGGPVVGPSIVGPSAVTGGQDGPHQLA